MSICFILALSQYKISSNTTTIKKKYTYHTNILQITIYSHNHRYVIQLLLIDNSK